MHVDGDVLADHSLGERNESLRDVTQDHSGVGGAVDAGERQNEIRRGGHSGPHGDAKQFLFGVDVPQHGGRRHAQLLGDIGECGSLETLGGENAPCGLQKLVPADARRPPHL